MTSSYMCTGSIVLCVLYTIAFSPSHTSASSQNDDMVFDHFLQKHERLKLDMLKKKVDELANQRISNASPHIHKTFEDPPPIEVKEVPRSQATFASVQQVPPADQSGQLVYQSDSSNFLRNLYQNYSKMSLKNDMLPGFAKSTVRSKSSEESNVRDARRSFSPTVKTVAGSNFAAIRDDVYLVGPDNNNFAITDAPDNEFHVWRAPFPSFGEVLPKPLSQTTHQDFLSINSIRFSFEQSSNARNTIIDAAIKRYRKILFEDCAVSYYPMRSLVPSSQVESSAVSELSTLRIILEKDVTGEDLKMEPHLDMNESYTLIISRRNSRLVASEIWGLLRGLETFSQLVWQTSLCKLFVNETEINDKPRFKHRGLHIDTSRHFISKKTLYKNLDAMAYNKLNVFHWHIVDDQSFPYQSEVFPELSLKGAYDPVNNVYSLDDIRDIVEYARLRGIRVIPEFDTPAHTHSWTHSFPNLFTKCYENGRWNGFLGPFNPAENKTFTFLHSLYKEILSVFKDSYVHIGADEIGTNCWESNPDIQRMKMVFGLNRPEQVIDYYYRKLQNLITRIGFKNKAMKRGFIVWQEAYDHGLMLKPGTIVQIWKGEVYDLQQIAQNGFRTLYSTCWYLDRMEANPQWIKFYLCDPAPGTSASESSSSRKSWSSRVLGGEACMWMEYQDENTVTARIWPLTSVVAERLWSQESVRDLLDAGKRLEEHRCRMRYRYIDVGVGSGPGSCHFHNLSSEPISAAAEGLVHPGRRPEGIGQPVMHGEEILHAQEVNIVNHAAHHKHMTSYSQISLPIFLMGCALFLFAAVLKLFCFKPSNRMTLSMTKRRLSIAFGAFIGLYLLTWVLPLIFSSHTSQMQVIPSS